MIGKSYNRVFVTITTYNTVTIMSLSLANSHCKKGNIFTWIVVPSPVLGSRPEAERGRCGAD